MKLRHVGQPALQISPAVCMLIMSLEVYAVWRVYFYLCTLVINDSLQPAAGCNEQGQFQPKEQSMIQLSSCLRIAFSPSSPWCCGGWGWQKWERWCFTSLQQGVCPRLFCLGFFPFSKRRGSFLVWVDKWMHLSPLVMLFYLSSCCRCLMQAAWYMSVTWGSPVLGWWWGFAPVPSHQFGVKSRLFFPPSDGIISTT